jgi:glutathione S-transferase
MYALHCFCQSGNAFKVAFLLNALNALEAPWEAKFVDFMNGITRTGAWREGLNEMGEVPVLDDGDLRLTQSGVILTYLAEKHGKFGGKNENEKREMLRWILFDNHKFTSYFASYRFMKAFGPSAPDVAVMNWLRGRLDGAFNVVNTHLSTRKFLVGDTPTIADFSLCGYMFYPLEESGYEIAERFPNIAAWLGRLRAIPGWKDPYAMMPGERILPKW